jgi:hypothetical protein
MLVENISIYSERQQRKAVCAGKQEKEGAWVKEKVLIAR